MATKKKDEEHTFITVEIDRDMYFRLLEICLAEKKTLDELCSEALHKFVEAVNNGSIVLPKKKKRKPKPIVYRA